MEKPKIAWISVPAFVSVDRFIVPEISKRYDMDWYMMAKENESIDFFDNLVEMNNRNEINLFLYRIKEKNSNPKIISQYKKIIKTIKSRNYDLHFQVMIGMPYYMFVWKKIIGAKRTLVAIHNVHIPKGGTNYFFNKWYCRYTLRNFDYFHTFSKGQMDLLLKITKNKRCEYAPFMLMDYGRPTKEFDKNEITFLNFGLIREYKRIDVLIKAAQNAYEKTHVKFRVIIAGSCTDWDKYQQLIKYDELFDLRIRRIEDDEIPNLFAESDYFVVPYQDIAQSGAAIIALNYNIPIIASKLPAFEEYVYDNKTGYLIKPADEKDLTDVIVTILNNHNSNYHKLIDGIIDMKEKDFSVQSIVNRYALNFQHVIDEYK